MKSINTLIVLSLFTFGLIWLSCQKEVKETPEATSEPAAPSISPDTLREKMKARLQAGEQREKILRDLEQLIDELATREKMLMEKEQQLARLEDSLKAVEEQLQVTSEKIHRREIWMYSILALGILAIILALLIARSTQLKHRRQQGEEAT